MRRPVRIAAIALAVIALQAVAVVGYLRIEGARRVASGFAVTRLPGTPAPSLIVLRPDGTELDLATPRPRVRLVHFWATWCGPCRTELPALLARAAEVDGLELLAVSVDDDWDVVRGFFPRGLPAEVVRLRDPGAHRRYGTQALPDSYVLTPDGRVVEQIAGARDWSRPDARQYLRALATRWP